MVDLFVGIILRKVDLHEGHEMWAFDRDLGKSFPMRSYFWTDKESAIKSYLDRYGLGNKTINIFDDCQVPYLEGSVY